MIFILQNKVNISDEVHEKKIIETITNTKYVSEPFNISNNKMLKSSSTREPGLMVAFIKS